MITIKKLNKIMKRIIIIAAMALMSVSAFAQKLAYVDFNELVMLMPEMDEARATLEENSKTNEEIMMAMYEEYQTKVRMEWAAKKLATTDMKVGDISQMVGYSKQTKFTKAFKNYYHMTPLEYRRKSKIEIAGQTGKDGR